MSLTEAGQILDGGNPQPVAAEPEAPSLQAKTEESVSPKLQVLMERERQALNRERMAKSQEEKLQEKLKKLEEFESIKTNPKKALEVLGLSYDQLTESILKDGEIPPGVEIQRLRAELEEHKAQLRQEKEQALEHQKKQVSQQEEKAVSEFKTEINEYVRSNANRYELIDFENAHELIFDVIEEHYSRTINPETGVGKVMSIADAADKVEEHLEKKYLAAKDKNKIKAFWNTIPKPMQEQLAKKQETSQPPKTLTNNLGPKTQKQSTRPPEGERIAQILANFMSQRGA